MDTTADRAGIEALFRQLQEAHLNHDADAIVDAFVPDALIYDLAPPLGRRGMDRETLAAWLATWDGPIRIDGREVEITIEGDLAFASALNRLRGHQGGADRELWFRSTLCLRKTNERWRIVHEHASVPFYMDGSFRAAVDLEP